MFLKLIKTVKYYYSYFLNFYSDINLYFDIDYPEITNNESLNLISSVDERSIFENDCDDNKPCEDICKPGQHNWKHEVCMVCTVCGECTGYSYSCLSSIRSNRKSGQ